MSSDQNQTTQDWRADPLERTPIVRGYNPLRPKPRCSHCHAGLVLSNGCCNMCGRVNGLPEDFADGR